MGRGRRAISLSASCPRLFVDMRELAGGRASQAVERVRRAPPPSLRAKRAAAAAIDLSPRPERAAWDWQT